MDEFNPGRNIGAALYSPRVVNPKCEPGVLIPQMVKQFLDLVAGTGRNNALAYLWNLRLRGNEEKLRHGRQYPAIESFECLRPLRVAEPFDAIQLLAELFRKVLPPHLIEADEESRPSECESIIHMIRRNCRPDVCSPIFWV